MRQINYKIIYFDFVPALENKRSGEFNKPIIIYNSNGYFDKLLSLLDDFYNQKFNSISVKNCYYILKSANDTIEYINNYYKSN